MVTKQNLQGFGPGLWFCDSDASAVFGRRTWLIYINLSQLSPCQRACKSKPDQVLSLAAAQAPARVPAKFDSAHPVRGERRTMAPPTTCERHDSRVTQVAGEVALVLSVFANYLDHRAPLTSLASISGSSTCCCDYVDVLAMRWLPKRRPRRRRISQPAK